jgi:hypothetical protein
MKTFFVTLLVLVVGTGGLASCTDSLKGEGYKAASAPWGVRSAKWQKGEVNVYLRCLPDTIDPRGPKAK